MTGKAMPEKVNKTDVVEYILPCFCRRSRSGADVEKPQLKYLECACSFLH